MAIPSNNNVFIYDHFEVFFKHTDYFGFLQPYNFLEWTSYIRESFFAKKCKNFRQILESPIKMMTAKITCEMFSDSIFGDLILGEFTTSRIKKVSFDVLVKFYNKNSGLKLCETQHTLVFVDADTQQFTSVPENIKAAIFDYRQNDSA